MSLCELADRHTARETETETAIACSTWESVWVFFDELRLIQRFSTEKQEYKYCTRKLMAGILWWHIWKE